MAARQQKKSAEKLELTTYSKSNRIINAKGKSTALGLKIFAVGVREAKQNEDGSITAIVAGQQLRELFGNYNGSFYTQIKDLIHPTDETKPSILDWRIYIENAETEKIEGINVINDAKFEDGELSLTFNNKIKNDIYGLKDNYGKMSLATTIKLQSPYSIRMYEMFKAFMDKERAVTHNEGPYYITYNYDDFKQTLGLINPAQDVASARKAKKKELFPTYTSFRKNVLDKARGELNEISSVHMDYMPIRSGRGGRVTGLEFTLMRQKGNDGVDAQVERAAAIIDTTGSEMTDAKFMIISEVSEILRESRLSLVEVKAICDAAGYDQNKIKTAYELSQHAKGIDNLTGWLISAVREGYQPRDEQAADRTAGRKRTAGKASRNKAPKNSFHDFEQNEYDFDELESKLLGH